MSEDHHDEVLLQLRVCGDQGGLIRAKLRGENAVTSVVAVVETDE